jgi:hypothetical protein
LLKIEVVRKFSIIRLIAEDFQTTSIHDSTYGVLRFKEASILGSVHSSSMNRSRQLILPVDPQTTSGQSATFLCRVVLDAPILASDLKANAPPIATMKATAERENFKRFIK